MSECFAQNSKKVIGAAANYKELLKLLKVTPPKEPGIFLKPSTSIIVENEKIILPKGFKMNQEVELGVIIGKKGKHISKKDAMDYVGGYCVTLDMTATCKLDEARKNGMSWTLAKAFDTGCPVSKFIPKEKIPDPHNVDLWCSINEKMVQKGNTSDLLFDIPTLINFISQYMTLEPNDLILTGSMPGMGPVVHGDVVRCGIPGIVDMEFCVEEEC